MSTTWKNSDQSETSALYFFFSCNVNFISGYVLNFLDWFVIKQLLCVKTKTRLSHPENAENGGGETITPNPPKILLHYYAYPYILYKITVTPNNILIFN